MEDVVCYLLQHLDLLWTFILNFAIGYSIFFLRGLSDPVFELIMDTSLQYAPPLSFPSSTLYFVRPPSSLQPANCREYWEI